MLKLYEALTTYYETLFKTGYVCLYKTKQLLILDFLTDFINDSDYLFVTSANERGKVTQLYDFITNNMY